MIKFINKSFLRVIKLTKAEKNLPLSPEDYMLTFIPDYLKLVRKDCKVLECMLMPTLFGLIVDYISISLLPVFILVLLLLMTAMHEIMAKKAVCKFQFTEKEV